MLEHLLKKSGRIFDMIKENDKTIVQIHCFDGRVEFDFDKNGNLIEEWDNSSVTTWLSGGYYYD